MWRLKVFMSRHLEIVPLLEDSEEEDRQVQNSSELSSSLHDLSNGALRETESSGLDADYIRPPSEEPELPPAYDEASWSNSVPMAADADALLASSGLAARNASNFPR